MRAKRTTSLEKGAGRPKNWPPPVVFHQENPDEQDDNCALAAEDGRVLGETVIPDMCLNQMQEDEEGIGSQGPNVNLMQALRIAMFAETLSIINYAPYSQLVCQVASPRSSAGPKSRRREFPVVPAGAAVRQKRNACQS